MAAMMRSLVFACSLAIAASPAIAGPADPAVETTPCYGSTKDWDAWIQPGTFEPELVVTGEVTTPTGGSWNVLTLGRTPWDEPPRQVVDLQIRGMGEIVTNVVTTEVVRARFRVPPHFGGQSGAGMVIIECNGKEVGRIPAVRRVKAAD